LGHGCIFEFLVHVLSCVGRSHAMGWPPSKGSHGTSIRFVISKVNYKFEQAGGSKSERVNKEELLADYRPNTSLERHLWTDLFCRCHQMVKKHGGERRIMTIIKQKVLGITNRLLSLIRHWPYWKQ
jgi:hypothetical protein